MAVIDKHMGRYDAASGTKLIALLCVLVTLGSLAWSSRKQVVIVGSTASRNANLTAATSCPACPPPAAPLCTDVRQGGCDREGKYDFSHLTQSASQDVVGPIQDDEALLLYAVVRGMRMSSVVEIGGLGGYSATNFLSAMEPTKGIVFTVDINEVKSVHPTRHKFIHKDAALVTADDFDNQPLGLVFFDCHLVEAQMNLYKRLVAAGLFTNETIIALHDTNTHPDNAIGWGHETPQGWVHQTAEREMVNTFKNLGFDAFMLHPNFRVHSPDFPRRHGVTLMTKFQRLLV